MCTIYCVYTVYVYRCVWMIDEQIYRVRNKWKIFIQSQTKKKNPPKTLNFSSSFLEFKWKFLHILLWRYQFFTIFFHRVFPVIPKVIKFLLFDTMGKSQIFTFFHIFSEILSDGFLKSMSSLFCVNTHKMIFF